MKNAIELARVTKEVYRATNELLQIVVHIKTKSKKMKEYKTIGREIVSQEQVLGNAVERVTLSICGLINWAYTVVRQAEKAEKSEDNTEE